MSEQIIDHIPTFSTDSERMEPVSYSMEMKLLKNQSEEITANEPLMSKQEALRKHGINGSVLAVITLPLGETEDKPKEIALVDFGEFEPGDGPPVMVIDGLANPYFFGRAKTRYGLNSLNYTPEEHLASYCPLVDTETVFGRTDDSQNYILGINPGSRDVEYISRKQFTISLSDTDNDPRIIIKDHSSNGTGLTFLSNKAIE